AKGCTASFSFTITQPAAAISNTASQTNVTCNGEAVGSATVVASGGTGSYTYNWLPSGGNNATATNLTAGNYSCTISDANGCSIVQNFTITQPVSTTWNGSVWSNGYPAAGTKAIINADYTSIGDLTACSLDVTGTANVTVVSGHDFVITNKVAVATTAQLTFNNNANLIQINDVVNIGKIVSKRDASMRRLDYTYWSSPIAGQFLKAFSPQTVSPPVGASRFYTLDEPTNAFVVINDPVTTEFALAKGFMIRAPNDFPTTVQTFTGVFTGVPNNGTAQIPVTATAVNLGFNMLGNPYPSPVDANLFLTQNPGTLYFWTHYSQTAASGANYATYNLLGGASAAGSNVIPNGTIQTGQGFLLKKSTAGNAIFTNAMRIGNNQGQFFRNANTIEKHRIWLNLSNASGMQNQMLLGYMTGATDGFDVDVDGKLIEASISSISSIIADVNYTIQGRPVPFTNTDIVPLHFKAATAGTYTLSIDHLDGLFLEEGQDVFLKDNLIGITHNIKQSDYTFASEAGTFAERFSIVYQNTTLGIAQPTVNPNSVVIIKDGGNIVIHSSIKALKNVTVFDLLGRVLYNSEVNYDKTFNISNIINSEQVILIKITTEDNQIITKRVL
ncbi:MAG: T9SS sorting signal type C domain-containing protein, partial [Flavobacterium sp.]|nr:T9SS sorting signal type C domain-containing protein [Flavobacterium sp.]